MGTLERALPAVALMAVLSLGALLPTRVAAQDPGEPTPTPFTVAPKLLNRSEVGRALIREYPRRLRDLGIGGRVSIWFYIELDGTVRRTLIQESSGHVELDRAALNVAAVYRFSPALDDDDQPVAVWVNLPITFQVRERQRLR